MDRSPRLSWSEAGAPLSGRFNDVYFSREDGLAESRAVFLRGCGLPEAWAGRDRFVVGELGFGSGLNIAALIDLWLRQRPGGGKLHVFSVEGFPLAREDAARALSAWPELGEAADRLLDRWPHPTPGFHRLDWPDIGVTFDLAVGEAAEVLADWSGRADAWFLDGFAPSTNPEMWSDAVLDLVAVKSAPGARIATFTVAGHVRRGLSARGFDVEKRPGHGRKRERLEAVLTGAVSDTPPPQVAVVGAGVAGAAVARALAELGVRAIVFDQEGAGAGASGFPSALVTPRLDVGDAEIAALHAQALAHADALYRRADAVVQQGVLRLQTAPRDAARFAKIAAQPWWPPGAMEVWAPAKCSARLGEAVEVGGLMMHDASTVAPRKAVDAWLAAADLRQARVASLDRVDEGWRLRDAAGTELARVQAVVLACGWGLAELRPELGLSPVRGQADWVSASPPPPAAWGGYVAPTPDGFLFGATHDRGETGDAVSDEATARNRATLAARLPGLAASLGTSTDRRAAVRATTADRLPLAGGVGDHPGLFVLGGLGSRGFCLAPLLGEHVAALALGAPSPLPVRLARRLEPGRFGRRNPADA